MKSKAKLIIYNLEIIVFSIVSTRIVEMFRDTFGRTTKYLLETIVFITVVMGILVNRWIILGGIKLLYNYMFKEDIDRKHTRQNTTNTTDGRNIIKDNAKSSKLNVSKDIGSKLKVREKYKRDTRTKQSDDRSKRYAGIKLGDDSSNRDRSAAEDIKRYGRDQYTPINRIVDISGRTSMSHKEKPLVKNKNICIEYKSRIKHNKNKRTFGDNIKYILNQMDRFISKLKILSEMIEMRFRKGEITYARLYMGLEEIEDIFYKNILRIIHKLEAFDENEYFHTMNEKSNVSRRIMDQKNRIYREYKVIIKELIETNEEILIKMDELILEFSGLSIQEDKRDGKLVASEKIDELIGMTRLYK